MISLLIISINVDSMSKLCHEDTTFSHTEMAPLLGTQWGVYFLGGTVKWVEQFRVKILGRTQEGPLQVPGEPLGLGDRRIYVCMTYFSDPQYQLNHMSREMWRQVMYHIISWHIMIVYNSPWIFSIFPGRNGLLDRSYSISWDFVQSKENMW